MTITDSLKQELKKIADPKIKLLKLLELSEKQIDLGDKEAIFTTETARSLAYSLKQDPELAKALNLQGIAWKIWGDNQKSILYLYEALEIYQRLNMQNNYAGVLVNIGETNRAAGNLSKSMELLNEALIIYIGSKDSNGLARTYNRLAATCYEKYGDIVYGNEEHRKPLENKYYNFNKIYNSNDSFRIKYNIILNYAHLANSYSLNKDLIAVKISTNIIIAALFSVTHQPEKAIKLYNEVLEDIRKSNSAFELPLALYNIGVLHLKTKNYEKAMEFAREGYRIATKHDIKSYIFICAGLIGAIYEDQGKYKEALDYNTISYYGRMDYYQKDIEVKLRNLQHDFEIERKQKEIKNRNIMLWVLFISFMIIISTNSIFLVILLRKNKRQKTLNVELKSMNMVIQQQNETLEQRVADRTRELETTNKELAFHLNEIEQFTFIASHDLQEPLLTLSNYTRLIKEEYSGKLDDDGNKSIEFISRSADRMRGLVKSLLDYSLLGKEQVKSPVDCNQIMEVVLSDLAASIASNNATVTVSDLPTINGFPVEISMLFQNLVVNAIKFRNKETAPVVNVSAICNETEYTFTVEDNGIGIAEKDQEKIFIIFRRTHNRNEYAGIGIGLAHCKKIVELHGGSIRVESAIGIGSKFIFTIPL
ncbi:MAG: ATP-binding protein [Bacteroidales bacterium]